MSSITVDEIKTLLRIDDSWSEQETVTFSSMAWKRLSHKIVASIYRVDTDTEYTTASAYDSLDYKTTKDYRGYTLINRIDTGTIADTETVYVSYSYGTYDELIATLLPIVENDICTYLNNWFIDEATEYEGGDFKLIARSGSSHPCITDTVNSKFVDYGFQDDMDITLTGTPRNCGIYHVSDAAASKLKLSSGDTLLAESSTVEYGGHYIRLHRIKWPVEIKRAIANIVWWNVSRARDDGISSKSLDPSSVSYSSISSGGYPPSVVESINKYKNIIVI